MHVLLVFIKFHDKVLIKIKDGPIVNFKHRMFKGKGSISFGRVTHSDLEEIPLLKKI